MVAQRRLGGGRIHHAMRTVAACKKAFDMMCERVLSRESHGKVIAEHQMVQEAIADSYAEYQMLRLLVLRTAWKIDNSSTREARTADRGVQVHRGQGAARHRVPGASTCTARSASPTSRRCRACGTTVPMMFIMDGPDEVHKVTVARNMLRSYAPHDGNWPTEFLPHGAKPRRRSTRSCSPAIRELAERVEHARAIAVAAHLVTDDEARRRRARPSGSAIGCPVRGPPRRRADGADTGHRQRAVRPRAAAVTQWVLRRPPAVKNDPSASDTMREWRILTALDGTPVPHPTPRLLCEDLDGARARRSWSWTVVDGFTPGFELPEPFASDHAPAPRPGDGVRRRLRRAGRGRLAARGGLEGLGKPDGLPRAAGASLARSARPLPHPRPARARLRHRLARAQPARR